MPLHIGVQLPHWLWLPCKLHFHPTAIVTAAVHQETSSDCLGRPNHRCRQALICVHIDNQSLLVVPVFPTDRLSALSALPPPKCPKCSCKYTWCHAHAEHPLQFCDTWCLSAFWIWTSSQCPRTVVTALKISSKYIVPSWRVRFLLICSPNKWEMITAWWLEDTTKVFW